MDNKNKYYFRNVSRRWKAEAAKAKEIKFFSPYITSSTAETVMLSDVDERFIYTCFDAENFLRKASSLSTLKKLLLRGCKLFHIENLHAKVMLTDNYMSIGSQNLTNRGNSNKEVTFCTVDAKSIQYGHNCMHSWTQDAEEISLEMIDKMESLIAPFIKDFEIIRKSMIEIDENFVEEFNNQKFRSFEEWQTIILDNLSMLEVSSNTVSACVRKILNGDLFSPSYTYSLVPSPTTFDLTRWKIDNKYTLLEKKMRYLLFDAETSKIGWARINKTRITFFCDSIMYNEVIYLGHSAYSLEFEANWGETRNQYNLKIILIHKVTGIELVYKCFFDLQFFNNIQLDENESSEYAFLLSEQQSWMLSNMKEFEEVLAEKLLSPFKYEEKLIGGEADDFYEYANSFWKNIKLARNKSHIFLVSEPY